jgi:hypothetical protein
MSSVKEYVWGDERFNVHPCEAMQFHKGDPAIVEWASKFGLVATGHSQDGTSVSFDAHGAHLEAGAWLVCTQSGSAHVSKQEPRWVDHWQWGLRRFDEPLRIVTVEGDARHYHRMDPKKYRMHRRPVLDDETIGKWQEVQEA